MSLLFSHVKSFMLFFVLSCCVLVSPLYADGFGDCNDLYGCIDNGTTTDSTIRQSK